MNLVIDVGNTLVKVAVFQNNSILKSMAFPKENFLNEIEKILVAYPQVSHSISSSVQEYASSWLQLLEQKTSFLNLSSETKIPFNNKYETPKTLGIDRITLMGAASIQYLEKNVLVIDAGTCITYDFINSKNEYLGGAISPGLKMRAKAMSYFTAKLPLVEIELENIGFLGKNTQQCMQIGVVKAAALEIDGFIQAYKNEFQDLTVILTGGDSEILSKNVKNSIFAPSNFLLQGLNRILEFNKSS
jgi:type III pantothenate kinase